METEADNLLYKIQNDSYHFHTGYTQNGNQILMGVQFPEIVMVEFDKAGNYLTILARAIPQELLSITNGIFTADDNKLFVEIQSWQKEINFVPGTISVRKFFLPDRWIGIQDLPDYLRDVSDYPSNYDPQERQALQEQTCEWQDSGDFVLYWVEDYYLDKEGGTGIFLRQAYLNFILTNSRVSIHRLRTSF